MKEKYKRMILRLELEVTALKDAEAGWRKVVELVSAAAGLETLDGVVIAARVTECVQQLGTARDELGIAQSDLKDGEGVIEGLESKVRVLRGENAEYRRTLTRRDQERCESSESEDNEEEHVAEIMVMEKKHRYELDASESEKDQAETDAEEARGERDVAQEELEEARLDATNEHEELNNQLSSEREDWRQEREALRNRAHELEAMLAAARQSGHTRLGG